MRIWLILLRILSYMAQAMDMEVSDFRMASSMLGRRLLSTATATASTLSGRMSAWQITSYDTTPRLVLTPSARIPTLERPDDVLIEVHAASVNPLDVQMASKTLEVGFEFSLMGGFGSL